MSNGLSLYEIGAEYRALAAQLADECGDDEQALTDTLSALRAPLEQKAVNVAFAVRNIEAVADAIRDAEKRMAERRKALEKRAERVRAYLKAEMEASGITRIESPHFVLAIRDNPLAVDIIDAAALPAEYMRTPEPPPPTPDKVKIKDALKGGKVVPGAGLSQGTRLEIK